MTRHARNSTAGSVYTYHEKKKDSQQSGFGTDHQRLHKDSIKSEKKIIVLSENIELQLTNLLFRL